MLTSSIRILYYALLFMSWTVVSFLNQNPCTHHLSCIPLSFWPIKSDFKQDHVLNLFFFHCIRCNRGSEETVYSSGSRRYKLNSPLHKQSQLRSFSGLIWLLHNHQGSSLSSSAILNTWLPFPDATCLLAHKSYHSIF